MSSLLFPVRFCDVAGCRKPAFVVHLLLSPEDEDVCLCDPCYQNLVLCRPDLIALYRPIDTSDAGGSELGAMLSSAIMVTF